MSIGSAPPFLSEREIHADDQNLGVGQIRRFIVETLCLFVTSRSVERGNGRDNSRLSSARGQRDVSQVAALQCKFGSRAARLQFRSGQINRSAL